MTSMGRLLLATLAWSLMRSHTVNLSMQFLGVFFPSMLLLLEAQSRLFSSSSTMAQMSISLDSPVLQDRPSTLEVLVRWWDLAG